MTHIMRKRAKVGGPKKAEAAERYAALASIMPELDGLSDGDASRELNKRDIPTMNGGRWRPDGFQIGRLRQRLGGDSERKRIRRIYDEVRKNLVAHFGPTNANDERLLDATAWVATAVYRKEQLFNLASDLSGVTSELYRQYKRDRGMLGALLNTLRIASDTFELVPPRQLPLATKSRATLIFEDMEVLARVEAAVAPKAVATAAPKSTTSP
jgi:hypothetical protein